MSENTPDDRAAFLALIHQMMVNSQHLREEITVLTQSPLDFPNKETITMLTALDSLLAMQSKLINLLVEENSQMLDKFEELVRKATTA